MQVCGQYGCNIWPCFEYRQPFKQSLVFCLESIVFSLQSLVSSLQSLVSSFQSQCPDFSIQSPDFCLQISVFRFLSPDFCLQISVSSLQSPIFSLFNQELDRASRNSWRWLVWDSRGNSDCTIHKMLDEFQLMPMVSTTVKTLKPNTTDIYVHY